MHYRDSIVNNLIQTGVVLLVNGNTISDTDN